MSDLEPCPACRRHVRIDEDACPFCGGALAPAAPRALSVGRMTRAAVFAGAALATAATGCGGKQKTGDGTGTGTASSIGNAAAIDGGAPTPPDAAPQVETDHNIPMPYGAPPVRERLV